MKRNGSAMGKGVPATSRGFPTHANRNARNRKQIEPEVGSNEFSIFLLLMDLVDY